jgi:RNA polymerase sigma factor (sigma-70 family)
VNKTLEHLRRFAADRAGADPPDGVLVGRFVDRRDPEAFAELVRRHGPMVWGVCRRALDRPDAEDAFQATFLVLVRKAGAVSPRGMVANWLYGVARRTAAKARGRAGRRRVRERPVDRVPEPAAAAEPADDLRPVLDEELARLPDKLRAAVVLCDLEGKTRAAAARELGWPEGTVSWRLAAARKLLAARLTRRGVTLGAGGLASAAVPPEVVAATIRAAAGAVPARVEHLTTEVVTAMYLSKLKSAGLVLGLAAVVVAGGIGMAGSDGPKPAPNTPPAAAAKPAAAEPEKQPPPFAWGEVVDGLQAGVGVRPGGPGDAAGGSVNFIVKVRNVGKADVTVAHLAAPFEGFKPTVRDDNGVRREVHMPPIALGHKRLVERTLKPGAEAEVGDGVAALGDGGKLVPQHLPSLRLVDEKARPERVEVGSATAFVPPGAYRISYAGFVQSHKALATGELRVVLGRDGGVAVGPLPEPDPDAEWAKLKGKWKLAASTVSVDGTVPNPALFNECEVLPRKDAHNPGWFILFKDGRHYAEWEAYLDPAEAPKAFWGRTVYREVDGLWYHQGIYKVDGDKLTVCVENGDLFGKGKRPTEFTAEKGSNRTLLVFERVKE